MFVKNATYQKNINKNTYNLNSTYSLNLTELYKRKNKREQQSP